MGEASENAGSKRGGLPAVMKGMHATREALAELERRVQRIEKTINDVTSTYPDVVRGLNCVCNALCSLSNETLPGMMKSQKVVVEALADMKKKLRELGS